IHQTQPLVIRLLAQCVADLAIRVRIWDRTIRKVRLGWNYPELRFDLIRGKPGDATRGFLLAIARSITPCGGLSGVNTRTPSLIKWSAWQKNWQTSEGKCPDPGIPLSEGNPEVIEDAARCAWNT